MGEEQRKILEMLAQGKITVDESERLLKALEVSESPKQTESKKIQYLKVEVDSKTGDKVNVRVPLKLVRAGMKLRSLIPAQAQEKVTSALEEKGINIDLNKISDKELEELVQSLTELTIDVDSEEGDKVRVYCE